MASKKCKSFVLNDNKVFCSVAEKNSIKYLKTEKNHCEPVINKWNTVFIKNSIKKLVMKK